MTTEITSTDRAAAIGAATMKKSSAGSGRYTVAIGDTVVGVVVRGDMPGSGAPVWSSWSPDGRTQVGSFVGRRIDAFTTIARSDAAVEVHRQLTVS